MLRGRHRGKPKQIYFWNDNKKDNSKCKSFERKRRKG
jgi:hypothetical protein